MTTVARLTMSKLRRAGLGAFFRPLDVEPLGISEPTLRRLVRNGEIEKISRGLYRLSGVEPSEHYTLASVCARVPKAILCLRTALQYHGIGTRLSRETWFAISHGMRVPTINTTPVRVIRFQDKLLTAGIEAIRVEGVPTKITSPVRTVVDCFRLSRIIDRETALEALRDILQSRRTSPASVLRMANTCGGTHSVKTALEVLGG